MISKVFQLCWRYLLRGKAKHLSFISLVSVLGIILGVATLIIVISVMNGFDRDLMQRLLELNYHIVVDATEPTLEDIDLSLKNWQEVEGSSLFLQTQIFAKFDNYILPLTVRGFDFSKKDMRERFFKYVREEKGKQGFFIGGGIKEKFAVGDKIYYYPLKRNFKLQTNPVRGVFKIGLYDTDNLMVVADLEEARELGPNYSLFLGINIKDPYQADKFKKKLASLFPGVEVSTWMERNSALFSALKLEKTTMFVILSLIILVACFNIFSNLSVKVAEKVKDIGILKTLGFSHLSILFIFSLQGLFLGLSGILLGSFLGGGICLFLKSYHIIKIPSSIYYLDYLPVDIHTTDILIISSLTLLLCLIFSLLSSTKAMSITPVQALRYE